MEIPKILVHLDIDICKWLNHQYCEQARLEILADLSPHSLCCKLHLLQLSTRNFLIFLAYHRSHVNLLAVKNNSHCLYVDNARCNCRL